MADIYSLLFAVADYVSGCAVKLQPCDFSNQINSCENISKWKKYI